MTEHSINEKKIICLGNLNIDLSYFCDRLPEDHEKMRTNHFRFSFGGAASNTAYWLSKLSPYPVVMLGCCGDDVFGKQFIDHFHQNNIDYSQIQTHQHHQTNLMSIFVTPNSKRMISAGGANQALDINGIDLSIFNEHSHFHTAYRDANKVLSIAEKAKNQGASISMEWNHNYTKQHAELCDYCFLNQDDFLRWYNKDRGKNISDSLIDQLWKENFSSTGTHLVITQGSKGALAFTPDGHKMSQRSFEVEKMVDRTGGGDAFDAGFINAILSGEELSEALSKGLKLASDVIQYLTSIPKEITDFSPYQ